MNGIHGEDPGDLGLELSKNEAIEGVRELVGPVLRRLESASDANQSVRVTAQSAKVILAFIEDIQGMGQQNIQVMQAMTNHIGKLTGRIAELEAKKKKFWTP